MLAVSMTIEAAKREELGKRLKYNSSNSVVSLLVYRVSCLAEKLNDSIPIVKSISYLVRCSNSATSDLAASVIAISCWAIQSGTDGEGVATGPAVGVEVGRI